MDKKKVTQNWTTVHKDMTKKGLQLSFQVNREYTLAKINIRQLPSITICP